ncbi:unnamed protein product, partial [Mesorhabditis spiculigera]
MLVRRPGSHVPVTPTITIPNAVELLNKIPIQRWPAKRWIPCSLRHTSKPTPIYKNNLLHSLSSKWQQLSVGREAEQAREQELRRLHSEALHHMGAYYRAAVSSRINPIDQMFALLELSMNEARHQEK